jgi:hypothetical protein
MPMSSVTVFLVRRMPVTLLMKNRAVTTAISARTTNVSPAKPNAPARPPGAPAQCRKYA